MRLSDFDYSLPQELIARYPLPNRTDSRLLVVDPVDQSIMHSDVKHLLQFLNPNDLLVFNDTKVLAARLYGHRATGGKVEVLIERIQTETQAIAHVRSNKKLKQGERIYFDDQYFAEYVDRASDLFVLSFSQSVLTTLNACGHMPLPPYMSREDELSDQERYQTVYSKELGSAAAPTAGLHFDQDLLKQIDDQGIKRVHVTLHVGSGTFQPVRAENITEHKMHSEWINVSQEVCDAIQATKQNGGRVIAIGTTSLRSLESASSDGVIKPYQGETDIFIYPGYEFRCVDALMTNFHLPKSTLLMLVSAFAGRDFMLSAYQEAIEQRYRFFSYGDAMLITHKI